MLKTASVSPVRSGNQTINDGNLVIGTSGNGIDFSATTSGSGTMTSELFSDYEEGTWTPAFATDGTPFDVAPTYNVRAGSYTKIGRMVFCTFWLDMLSVTKGAASGNIIITGLPFTANATRPGGGMPTFAQNWATNNPDMCRVVAGGTSILLYYRSTANGSTLAITVASFDTYSTANRIEGYVTYYV